MNVIQTSVQATWRQVKQNLLSVLQELKRQKRVDYIFAMFCLSSFNIFDIISPLYNNYLKRWLYNFWVLW